MTSALLQATSAPTENLAGLVERVTFHKEDNGFRVLRLKERGQRDLVTVVGHAAMIAASEWVQAASTWRNDRTHAASSLGPASCRRPRPRRWRALRSTSARA